MNSGVKQSMNGNMSNRARFLATMRYTAHDRTPLVDFRLGRDHSHLAPTRVAQTDCFYLWQFQPCALLDGLWH